MNADNKLSVTRKADRDEMARQLIELVNGFEGCSATLADSRDWAPREVAVEVECPRGLLLTILLDGAALRGFEHHHMLSWHINPTSSNAKLADYPWQDVNKFHRRKATDFAFGFADLKNVLRHRLQSIVEGSAFLKEVTP